MSKRLIIMIGAATGFLWSLAVVSLAQMIQVPFIPLPMALPMAFFLPGLVLTAMIVRLAQRRFFTDEIIDGQRYAAGTPAEIDQRVLTNTVEQLVVALTLWPLVALTLGGAVAIALGVSFALMRLLFWGGYHISPHLRSFGFAGTFYPSIVAAIWGILRWIL